MYAKAQKYEDILNALRGYPYNRARISSQARKDILVFMRARAYI